MSWFLESQQNISGGVIPSFAPNAMIWMDQVDWVKIRVNQIGKSSFLNIVLKQVFQPTWKICNSQIGSFPQVGLNIQEYLKSKPPPSMYIYIYIWNHYLLFGRYIGISQLCGYQPPVMVKVGNLKVPKKTREANWLENTKVK